MSPIVNHFRCMNPSCRKTTPIPTEMLEELSAYLDCQTMNISSPVLACIDCKHVGTSLRSPTAPMLYSGDGLPRFPDWDCELLFLKCDEATCQTPTPVIALKKSDTTIEELRKAIAQWPIYGALVCRQDHQISQVDPV
jgi:hypothetical protein